MAAEIRPIVLKREPVAYPDGSVPGTLTVGDHQFPTIERGHGYTSLRVGDYKMVHSWKGGKRSVKCLRPVEENKAYLRNGEKSVERVLIHDAYRDSSTELEGCISPGISKKPGRGMGIQKAAQAMEKIWELLGGFESEKKTVTLHVINNVPGVSGIRETWDRVSTLSIRKRLDAG